MPNQITLPKGISSTLDEVYRSAAVTSVLDSDPTDLRPTANVNEFCYPQLQVGGLGDYDRASGYTANSGVKLDWETVSADYDRGTKIMVDQMDNQETFDLAFGKAAAELLRVHVAPEGDAYTFAKISSMTGISKKTGTLADGEAFLKALLDGSAAMDEAEVPEEKRYLFVTPTLLKAVKALDTTKSREALDGFTAVIKTPQSRFVTAIDLLDGKSTGEIEGGWKKAEAGKNINFLIVHKPAIVKYDRHVVNNIIPASMNPDADADIVKYRKYGVVDGYENKRAGIYLHHVA